MKEILFDHLRHSCNYFKRIQTFLRRLSLVTKVGFMATTLKVSSNRRNGRALLHLGQKKLDKSRATLSPC
jgi:hypothetical protein